MIVLDNLDPKQRLTYNSRVITIVSFEQHQLQANPGGVCIGLRYGITSQDEGSIEDRGCLSNDLPSSHDSVIQHSPLDPPRPSSSSLEGCRHPSIGSSIDLPHSLPPDGPSDDIRRSKAPHTRRSIVRSRTGSKTQRRGSDGPSVSSSHRPPDER